MKRGRTKSRQRALQRAGRWRLLFDSPVAQNRTAGQWWNYSMIYEATERTNSRSEKAKHWWATELSKWLVGQI